METSKVFVLDGGNTHIKLGTFEGHQLLQTQRFQERTALGNLLKSTDKVVVANVGELQLQQDLIDMGCQVYTVSNSSLLPFTNAYKTPSTLGIDRLCNIVAAHEYYPNRNILVIDAGTCIKFDFIDYLGIPYEMKGSLGLFNKNGSCKRVVLINKRPGKKKINELKNEDIQKTFE